MDDVWGNAWSTPGSSSDTQVKQPTPNAPKWNTFERDADDDTVDVGASSWNAGSGLAWGGSDSNMWHAESSTLDAWSSGVAHKETDAENEEPLATLGDEPETEDGKSLEPRPILPTPPQSPLPLSSPPLTPSSAVEDISPSSPTPVRTRPGSPDPFGSFKTAQAADADAELPQDFSWAMKSSDLPAEATDEPWGGTWGRQGESTADEEDEGEVKDEWELAQEAKRRQERKVPPQLLASLITEWEKYADDISPDTKSDGTGAQSWRKGLDNVEGLADLVESLVVPVASIPPVQLSKSAVSRAVNECLRLTRSLALTRSSPMTHLYASKGSTDWERSVKAQKTSANDEWGWDLKHEPEERSDSTESAKEKKGGLLSFWSKKSSSITPNSDTNAPNQQKSPTTAVKPTSPTASARPSIDVTLNISSSAIVPPIPSSTPPVSSAATPEPVPSDGTAQPSVVSRFLNRFSRKPSTSPTSSEKDNHGSLVLSEDDLSVLSDMVPSTSGISAASESGSTSLLHSTHDSTGSLEAMLMSQPPKARSSSSKLPPPLAPPPPASHTVRPASARSATSDASFDAQMADAQIMNILENMGQFSSSPGYAPVAFDLIDSPKEPSAPPSKLRSPVVLSPVQAPSPPPSRQRQISRQPLTFTTANPILSPTLPPPLPPPITSSRPEARISGILVPTTSPPLSPLRNSRYESPLPPTPKRSDLDDFSEFFSSSALSPSKSPPGPSTSFKKPGSFPTRQPPSVASTGTDSVDFGDFGDFVSPSMQPPPSIMPMSSRAAKHKPTAVELVENAASMTGRWPAPPSPLPQPLAPPPGQGYFVTSSTQQPKQDLLSDESSLKSSPAFSGSATPALPPPLFAGPPSHPASLIPRHAPPPLLASRPRSVAASPSNTAPATASAKSGLSAQDLSFFEGL